MALWWGFLGVLVFSLTLPATRATVGYLDPVFVGLGRSVIAAILAALTLTVSQSPIPPWKDWPKLALVAAGAVVGFPLLTAFAMQRVPASHGAIIIGLLPLATAGSGTLFAGERPTLRFWVCGALGSAVVVAFALWRSGGALVPADGFLLLAVLTAAIGYAEGARLARRMDGWRVISWVLLLALPFILPWVVLTRPLNPGTVPLGAWLGFAYVSIFSAFLGFVAWYRGLAMGGIAQVGQVQLFQTFLTLAASSLLLREALSPWAFIAAALVGLCVFLGRKNPKTA